MLNNDFCKLLETILCFGHKRNPKKSNSNDEGEYLCPSSLRVEQDFTYFFTSKVNPRIGYLKQHCYEEKSREINDAKPSISVPKCPNSAAQISDQIASVHWEENMLREIVGKAKQKLISRAK
ncbi:Hypothetical predicted protein [Olea europaea subsp. europaea]|uniref:Uncharacterized protein n=1 Tax=Olea europaea subsp. europaea TaxID=158383 RepID=A0A8S0ST51_OLEEU|nr:Hypothetical predicted protein [Olea europaea subsp. europaea]